MFEREDEDDLELEVAIDISDDVPHESEDEDKNATEDEEIVSKEVEESEDEKKEFGKRAERRIKGLIRQKKQAEDDLLRMQTALQEREEEIENLKGKTRQTEEVALEQIEQSLSSEKSGIRVELEKALEDQDTAKIIEAQEKLVKLQTREAMLENAKRRRSKDNSNYEEKEDSGKKTTQQQELVDPRTVVSEGTRQWMNKNPWFWNGRIMDNGVVIPNRNYDPEMTQAALELHYELESEGFNEAENSDEYFKELDNRLSERYPEKFKKGSKVKSSVSSSVRPTSAKGGKQKIKLTRDQVEFCERNNIDKVKYARELAKLESAGE